MNSNKIKPTKTMRERERKRERERERERDNTICNGELKNIIPKRMNPK